MFKALHREVFMNKSVLSIVLLSLLCLVLPGSIRADTVNINSINANSSPFSVDITTTNLLAQYGIKLANVTPGTTVFVACGECGGNSVVSSSPPNVLIQLGNDNGMSYTLQFSTPLSTLSFTLAGNSKSGGSGTLVAGWSATASDASGNVISSVGDPSLFGTFSPFPPQPFTLVGPGIASVTFFTQCFNVCGTGLNIADLSAPEIKLVSSPTFSLLSGDGQADPPLTVLPKPLVVKVTDQNGFALPGVPISFAITQQPSGANGASLDSSTVTTAADGTASVQLTLGDTSGQYGVTASCTSCTPTVLVFSETAGKKVIIVLDPGHGQLLDDSGGLHFQRQPTKNFHLIEDVLTLQIASATASKLQADGFQVFLTRTSDLAPISALHIPCTESSTFDYCNADLQLRVQITEHEDSLVRTGAMDPGAIFVSIHTNGNNFLPNLSGTEVFDCRTESFPLSQNLLTDVLAIPNATNSLGIRNGCSKGLLRDLTAVQIENSLIEVAYHSNTFNIFGGTTDEQRLNDPAFRQNAANAIATAIEDFINSL